MQQFFKSLSTISILTYTSSLLTVAAVCQNPFYQMIVLICLVLILALLDKSKVKSLIQLLIFIGLPVIIINPIVNQSGTSVLFSITGVPVFGRVDITLESMAYSFLLVLRLSNTILVFGIFNLLIHPDKLLTIFSYIVGKSTLIITITSRLIPSLSSQLRDIADIQKTRGASIDAGNPFRKIKAWYPFSKIILFSGLESSYGIAEAMQSKGYGAGKRTIYYNEKQRAKDLIIAAGIIFLTGIVLGGFDESLMKYSFFPKLAGISFSTEQIVPAIISTGLIVFPVVIFGLNNLISNINLQKLNTREEK